MPLDFQFVCLSAYIRKLGNRMGEGRCDPSGADWYSGEEVGIEWNRLLSGAGSFMLVGPSIRS